MNLPSIEKLAELHPKKNDPYEPFSGVYALFGADLHTYAPEWAPRRDWIVVSPYEIKYLGASLVSTEVEVE